MSIKLQIDFYNILTCQYYQISNSKLSKFIITMDKITYKKAKYMMIIISEIIIQYKTTISKIFLKCQAEIFFKKINN